MPDIKHVVADQVLWALKKKMPLPMPLGVLTI
jgi:hypothetical protein